MQQILQAINNSALTPISQVDNVVANRSSVQMSAINPSNFSLSIGEDAHVDLVLLHGDNTEASISISLGRGAKLNLTELFVGRAAIVINIEQEAGSVSDIVSTSISYNKVQYKVELRGTAAHSELHTLQMGAEKDNNALGIDMQHISPDCTSRSMSKCVASGESNLSFEGLVYVAQDAQSTAAEQNCRSIELSDSSHIVAQPQLEIYADDVKCSHGATMGQVNTDAIFYMRQRGLSEAQARRLQIEGFVTDIVEKCNIVDVCEALKEIVAQKLEEM